MLYLAQISVANPQDQGKRRLNEGGTTSSVSQCHRGPQKLHSFPCWCMVRSKERHLMFTAPCNWKQYFGGGALFLPSLNQFFKKIRLTQKQRSQFFFFFFKKSSQRAKPHPGVGCNLHIYRGRCSVASRVVFKGSITKYTKVLFLFTVHKRTLPHSQMRRYKTSHYLL